MKSEVAEAGLTDMRELASNMRAEDVREVRDSMGHDPWSAVVESMAKSTSAWALRFDDKLAAIWGVGPVPDAPEHLGTVWALTTPQVDLHPAEFIAACWQELPKLFGRWQVLANAIDCRYAKALRWGAMMGFRFQDPVLVGPRNVPFAPFTVTLEDVRCARLYLSRLSRR